MDININYNLTQSMQKQELLYSNMISYINNPFFGIMIILLFYSNTMKYITGLILTLIFSSVIIIEIFIYFIIRQLVVFIEFIFSMFNYSHVKEIKCKIENSSSYNEWKKHSIDLDKAEHLHNWKFKEKSSLYDWNWVKYTSNELKKYRDDGDIKKLVTCLRSCLRRKLGGVFKEELYSYTYYGTKVLIDSYFHEIETSMNFISKYNSDDFTEEDKMRFFYSAFRSFGNTALSLSGGAALGNVDT